MEKKVYKTKEESIEAYIDYVNNHVKCVQKAFTLYGRMICEEYSKTIPNVISLLGWNYLHDRIIAQIYTHDESKYSAEEFDAYRAYFYPTEEDLKDKDKIEEEFDLAWKHHYQNNKHHPEFWQIKIDDKYINLMPAGYFVEMICDWIGVSMAQKSSVYDWWYNKGGRSEKVKFFSELDLNFLDNLITTNKEEFDFSK